MGLLLGDMHPIRAPDARAAEIARRQHGVVTLDHLRDCGLSPTAVRERVRAGRLHRLHRSVYAVGHIAPSNERRWMAAVLAVGGTAVLSHRSAAELWGLLPPRFGAVDASFPGRGGKRKRQGIRIHRPASLEPTEITKVHDIPVTSPARTLTDLRRVVSAGELRHAIRQADFLGLPTGPDVASDRTRSELERQFLRLCTRYDLPKPAVNMQIGTMTVDFCWMEARLVVETDGYRAHRGRQAFEHDRARDLRLKRLGYETVHLSYRQVFDEPVAVIAALRPALIPSAGAR